jgi:hypothetical protein
MTAEPGLIEIYHLLGKNFLIPEYQRGFRWSEIQVRALLNDLWTFADPRRKTDGNFYCLQPVVIKQLSENTEEEIYEVIDGQQRLTTLYLILLFLAREVFQSVEKFTSNYPPGLFQIEYATRHNSQEFLREVNEEINEEYIDYSHISRAYRTISEWFEKEGNPVAFNDKMDFLRVLLGEKEKGPSVQIIWYQFELLSDEATNRAHSVALFNRLNMGKIPLTSAELVKAAFLSDSSYGQASDAESRKMKIALIWDEMEKQLRSLDFWYFLSNDDPNKYMNRIELLLDLISHKDSKNIDPYFTFLYFFEYYSGDQLENSDRLFSLWLQIEQNYRTLREWYENHYLYHKIGFLIHEGASLEKLLMNAQSVNKDEFNRNLDVQIATIIDCDFDSLQYGNTTDQEKMTRILLLFNIETVANSSNHTEFFPFSRHKKRQWTLEHIHAQNSEDVDRAHADQWQTWLKEHKKVLEALPISIEGDKEYAAELSALKVELDSVNIDKINWNEFRPLGQRMMNVFTHSGDRNPAGIHDLSNMALLTDTDNSSLGNSVFEVKRRMIIERDKQGKYIPVCTRHVFLKYYSTLERNQHLYFWGPKDREEYHGHLKQMFKKYSSILDKMETS